MWDGFRDRMAAAVRGELAPEDVVSDSVDFFDAPPAWLRVVSGNLSRRAAGSMRCTSRFT